MRLENQGTPSTVYYRGAVAQKPPVNTTPVTASGTAAFGQQGSAAFNIAGHPGLWLVLGVLAAFLILHQGRLGLEG